MIGLIAAMMGAAAAGGGGGAKVYTLRGSTGLTLIQNGNVDDTSINVGSLGLTTKVYGNDYDGRGDTTHDVYVASNSYLCFGSSSTAYSGDGRTTPGLRHLHVGFADRSYQRVYVGAVTGGFCMRFEGSGGSGGTVGSPTHLWEATLYTDGTIVVVTDISARFQATGFFMISDGTVSGDYTPYTGAADSGFLFTPDVTGGAWVITKER